MTIKDMFGREPQVGDFVCASVLCYKRAHLIAGKITKIHDSGKITIRCGLCNNGSISVFDGLRKEFCICIPIDNH